MASLRCQAFKSFNQVVSDSATDATIKHFDHLFISLEYESIVDTYFTELVFDNCYFMTVVLLEDIVHKGSLARSEESSKYSNGNFTLLSKSLNLIDNFL